MDRLIKSSFVPYYQQVKEILEKAIRKGRVKPGEYIPSEKKLGEMYQVSRITVRKAIDQLIQEGLVYRQQGRGTIAITPVISQPLRIISFTEEIRRRKMKPETKVLRKEITVSKKIAQCLGLKANEEMVVLERLRLANGEPLAIETSYLPQRLFPGILEENLSGSLRKLTEEKYGLKLEKAKQTIRAVRSSEREAKILKIKKTTPLLLIERISSLRSNQPAEFLHSLCRSDRYEFRMEL